MIARILERASLRYTPAGIPIISARLKHRSQQIEGETNRQVEFEISAIVIGDLSEKFEKLATDRVYLFTGFITTKSIKNKSLQFHITGFSSIE